MTNKLPFFPFVTRFIYFCHDDTRIYFSLKAYLSQVFIIFLPVLVMCRLKGQSNRPPVSSKNVSPQQGGYVGLADKF